KNSEPDVRKNDRQEDGPGGWVSEIGGGERDGSRISPIPGRRMPYIIRRSGRNPDLSQSNSAAPVFPIITTHLPWKQPKNLIRIHTRTPLRTRTKQPAVIDEKVN